MVVFHNDYIIGFTQSSSKCCRSSCQTQGTTRLHPIPALAQSPFESLHYAAQLWKQHITTWGAESPCPNLLWHKKRGRDQTGNELSVFEEGHDPCRPLIQTLVIYFITLHSDITNRSGRGLWCAFMTSKGSCCWLVCCTLGNVKENQAKEYSSNTYIYSIFTYLSDLNQGLYCGFKITTTETTVAIQECLWCPVS